MSLRIAVSGMIAADPGQGGATWAVLQYLLGFERLGHEVLFVEQCAPADLEPEGERLERSRNAAYFRRVMADHEFEDRSALLVGGTEETVGVPYPRLLELAAGADVLINISGMLTDERITSAIPVRVYLDLDPAFNQLWHEARASTCASTATPTSSPSAWRSVARAAPCRPAGSSWIPTLPAGRAGPVAAARSRSFADAFTTVGNWRGYGSIEHDGVHLRPEGALAAAADRRCRRARTRAFLLALAIHPDEKRDLEALDGQRLAAGRPGRGGRHAGGLPALHPGLEGRVRHRQERLRRVALRLVQRSQRLLSRLRPAGDRAGDRLQPLPADGRGPVRVRRRRTTCWRRSRSSKRDYARHAARRPRAGRGALRLRHACSRGCWKRSARS